MKTIRHVLRSWLPLAAAITLLSGVIYGTVQQVFRANADDPQVQLAEDAARKLEAGADPASVLPAEQVDIALSLAPYLVIYDAQGNAIASNAVLHGQTPELPEGVLDFARANGGHRVTHQPEEGVRSATVIALVDGGDGGFVLAGRSLREVEAREARLTQQVGLGLAGSLIGTLVLIVLLEILPFTRRND